MSDVRCTVLAYPLLIVRQFILVYSDNVHVGVALVFTDLLQLRVCLIDISVQLQQQDSSCDQEPNSPVTKEQTDHLIICCTSQQGVPC